MRRFLQLGFSIKRNLDKFLLSADFLDRKVSKCFHRFSNKFLPGIIASPSNRSSPSHKGMPGKEEESEGENCHGHLVEEGVVVAEDNVDAGGGGGVAVADVDRGECEEANGEDEEETELGFS